MLNLKIYNHSFLSTLALALLFTVSVSPGNVNAEQDMGYIYKDNRFALGVGAAIVKFDTKIKFTDKTNGDKIFIDPEGNLDLPAVSSVITLYGGWNFKPKHGLYFAYFKVNRESVLFDIDKNFDRVHVVGNATITDTTSFYQLTYGYSLFNDDRSRIKLSAGIYGLDMKYVFTATGAITVGGVTASRTIQEEAGVFAPLPMIGLDFLYGFTPSWSLKTKVGFVAGVYEDVTAGVLQTSINAQYKISRRVGLLFGLAYFDALVEIENDLEKTEVTYGYDGGYIGMHFLL